MTTTYESPQMLADYLLFHYGADQDAMPWDFGPKNGLNYPARLADLCAEVAPDDTARALDLGCAVGRSTFEMARFADEVVGIDYSRQFIEAAKTLQQKGDLDYQMWQEGDTFEPRTARIDPQIDRTKVLFQCGDACNLPDDLGQFDIALLANLLCRLPRPDLCLERMKTIINPHGKLVIATPSSWSAQYTEPPHWLASGHSTLEGIRQVMEPTFSIAQVLDMPFVLREHRRKFQWTVAQVSVWDKRG